MAYERRGQQQVQSRNATSVERRLSFDDFRSELAKQEATIKTLLGDAMGVERFMQAVVTAVQRKPDVLNFPADSVISSCLRAAQDRLLPDGVQGAIVPRKNKDRWEATWQPMYQGLLLLAKKYAGVRNIDCELVYEGEEFKRYAGTDPKIIHIPDPDLANIEHVRAAYCIFWLEDGTFKAEVMTRAQLDDVMKTSDSAKSGFGPWRGPFRGEMMRKTVLRRGWKWVPATGEHAEIVTRAMHRVDEDYSSFGPRRDTLVEAGITPPAAPAAIAHEPASGVPGGTFSTFTDKLDAFQDQLLMARDLAELDKRLEAPGMVRWLDGQKRNNPATYGAVRDMIAAARDRLAAAGGSTPSDDVPDAYGLGDPGEDPESGAADGIESLPLLAPNHKNEPDTSDPDWLTKIEWRLYDIVPRNGETLDGRYLCAWQKVLKQYPGIGPVMARENRRTLAEVASYGEVWEAVSLQALAMAEGKRNPDGPN